MFSYYVKCLKLVTNKFFTNKKLQRKEKCNIFFERWKWTVVIYSDFMDLKFYEEKEKVAKELRKKKDFRNYRNRGIKMMLQEKKERNRIYSKFK